MKNKFFLSLALVALLGVLPAVGYAAYNDVTLGDTNTEISVGGVTLVVAGPYAVLESIVVDSDKFTVVMPGNSFLKVTSTGRRTLSTSGSSSITTTSSCTDSAVTYTFDSPGHLSSQTLVVTVDSGTCTTGGTVGGSGSAGGGGGGSSSYTYIPPSTTPATTVASAATVAAASTPATGAISGTIDRMLTKGMTNPGIRTLQQILNSDPDTRIAATGAGSPGTESDFFGSATLKAVQKFQVKYGIAKPGQSGYGNVGPLTRTILNSLAGKAAAPTSAPSTPSAPASKAVSALGTVSRSLSKGVTHSAVKILQQILNSDPDTLIAEMGTGSPGNESNFFGSATLKAVKKFQEKYGLSGPGEEGYGNVGPKTRAKLNEVGLKAGNPNRQVEDAMNQIKVLQDQLKTNQ